MKKIFVTLLFGIFSLIVSAQSDVQIVTRQLDWKTQEMIVKGKKTQISFFKGAIRNPKTPTLAFYSINIPVSQYGDLSVSLLNPIYELMETPPSSDDISFIKDDIFFQNEVSIARDKFLGKTYFLPIRKTAMGFERLTRFQLEFRLTSKALPTVASERGGPLNTSVLANGTILKFAIENTGVQRIDAKALKDAGIDISKIDPKKIKIYGNAGGMLPEPNAAFRYEDLAENACIVSGEDDGKFNDNDFILFYAVAADKWVYNKLTQSYDFAKNTYSNNSFYFVKIDGDNGKRIATKSNITKNPTYTSTSFDDFQRYEVDDYNVLDEYTGTPGGGRRWFGDKFSANKKNLTLKDFVFPNIDKSEKMKVNAVLLFRSKSSGSLRLNIDNESYFDNLGSCGACDEETDFGQEGIINESFTPSGENIKADISITSDENDMISYLDFIQLSARRKLVATNGQMFFRDLKTIGKDFIKYEISNFGNQTIWEVSNPIAPKKIEPSVGSNLASFVAEGDSSSAKEFLIFNANTDFFKPIFNTKVENQNLHGLENVEMLILHSKALEKDAVRLAAYRKSKNNINTKPILIDQVYNEFSSGALDPVAIRDFCKFLYEKNKNFKYLLLFGDGSFNYRAIKVSAEEQAQNHIPPYETYESLNGITAFPSDDYFGLLSPDEGNLYSGSLDIDIGRITASSDDMAKVIVDKIINYDENPETLRDYRNKVVFVADDFEVNENDGVANWETTFVTHSETLGNLIEKDYKNFNLEKVYLAAFPQITTPGGQRSPATTEAINNNLFKGELVLNYTGHGGPRGWSQERILNASIDVPTWSNYDRLPLFITATCSFSGYDSPIDFTAGEQILALDKGGAVGLFSTVRAVFASDNDALTEAVFRQIFKKNNYKGRTLGEILRLSKTDSLSSAGTSNNRKFTLLGDPSQVLKIPEYDIRTTKINSKDVSLVSKDTVGALQKLNLEGIVADSTGKILSDFNGVIYTTIYDKALNLKTVPIDKVSLDYRLQNKILFKGASSVKNGKFQVTCIIPKDINYDFGLGKISYYATNNINDAAGNDIGHLVIGGAGNSNIKDDKPPVVEVFIDNEEFVDGGITSVNPTLIARLSDDYGINISGGSVGHDLTGVLDNDPKSNYRLNDFYEAKIDNFAQGKVKYPLFKLAEGLHTIKVKAWDTSNNPGEGSTSFVVALNGKSALEHVLNYPNPFTTNTNFQFRHHLSEINLKVQVQVFTIGGKLVKTLETDASSNGNTVTDVKWDGKDDFGSDLAKGVYIYKIKTRSVRNANISEESAFEKLVILK